MEPNPDRHPKPVFVAKPAASQPQPARIVQKGNTQMIFSLRDIQKRLGTKDERPGDLELVRHLTHTVRNRSMAIQAAAEIEALKRMRTQWQTKPQTPPQTGI